VNRRVVTVLALLALSLGAAACGDDEGDGGTTTAAAPTETAPPAATTQTETQARTAPGGKPRVQVPKGAAPKRLVVDDLVRGKGRTARSGDQVTVHYVGVFHEDGEQFDASWDDGEPFQFTLGQGMVIRGWDRGVAGMREGGRRRLVIPPDLAYGPQGQPPTIPPNATLVFVVDLVSVG
jgi:peptidylprolyl isomerase